ncbi:hypothetical protein B0F90DRAFT_1693792 [Multifurca ochricompacta]|uniref:Uncharacterized protein n=1 Tax=Multifurca ochricompacta TaxID=376703 RepID=A0AAD4M915_9AGAM|nr:hypothetical protein B0F90DRAFT_1693792 [Multifurca ochricompacta]
MLLHAIYPVPSPSSPPPSSSSTSSSSSSHLTSNRQKNSQNGHLDALTDAWLAADKYEVSGLRENLTTQLQAHPLMTRQPLRMFGIAYYLRSQALLQTAAVHTLPLAPLTLDGLGRHVDLVPFIAIRHLIEYHRACGEAARDFILLKADEDGFAEFFLPGLLTCVHHGHSGRGRAFCRDSRCQFGNPRESMPRLETLEWWRHYMEALSEKLDETPVLPATAAMSACADQWEKLAQKLSSALVLAHTFLADVLKAELEDEVSTR